MNNDQLRWDERYSGEEYLLGRNPSPFLAGQIDTLLRLCPGLQALDIACGEGRNSIFLARQGFTVTGLDISPVGLGKARRWMKQEGLNIDFRRVDMETNRFGGKYDLIINFNFLLRHLFPGAIEALNPGGLLVVDTILEAPNAPVPHRKEFLLQPGELASIFSGLPVEILQSEEFPESATPTARILVRKLLA